MGVDVCTENQMHERTYAGNDAAIHLARVLEVAGQDGLIGDIYGQGATMFHVPQLGRLRHELQVLAGRDPDIRGDVDALDAIIDAVIRDRGYLWLQGD